MKSMIDEYLKVKGLKDEKYANFVNKLLQKGVRFAFLDSSFMHLRGEQQSGDLDLITSIERKDEVFEIMKSLEFRLYGRVNSNQYLFVNAGSSEGLVLIHVHFDFYLYGKKFFEFEEAYEANCTLKKDFQILVMVLGCLTKGKIRDFEHAFLKSIETASDEQRYAVPLKFLSARGYRLSKLSSLKFFIFSSPLLFLFYCARNLLERFCGVFTGGNVGVVFVGVDGAGKSTLISNVSATIGGRLVYVVRYHGLRASLVDTYFGKSIKMGSAANNHSHNRKVDSTNSRTGFMLVKSIMIFLEYSFHLLKSRLSFARIPIVYLYDRSYIDRMFYDSNYLRSLYRLLLRNHTFVFVTGDMETLYKRKVEVPIDLMAKQDKFYRDFAAGLDNVLVLDSTVLTQKECAQQTLKRLLKDF